MTAEAVQLVERNEERAALVRVVDDYFRLADAGDPELMRLFAEDLEFYFPKFGVGTGKAAFAAFVEGFMVKISACEHRRSDFSYVISGGTVVVEGTTFGASHDGGSWSGGETAGGRFCSVFEIREGLISRMYIYTDPDYTGTHDHGFGWSPAAERHW